jgi:hypothetical protein
LATITTAARVSRVFMKEYKPGETPVANVMWL